MTDLRKELVERLEQLPNVNVATYKDTDLLCVFHNGKEIAHFQADGEIDIRLTPSVIKKKGLKPPKNTMSHPDRSKNSRWIIQSYEDNLEHIVELIQLASQL